MKRHTTKRGAAGISVPGWAARAALGLLLGLAVRAFTPAHSDATHSFSPHRHINTMNSLAAEDICVQVEDQSVSFSTALGRIRGTLYEDNSYEDWDKIGSLRVYFAVSTKDCYHTIAFHPLEYSVKEAVSDKCGAGQVGCAFPISLPEDDAYSGHPEYHKFEVWLTSSWLLGSSYRFLINHETGHVLGLDDGTTSDCAAEERIMHLNDCPPPYRSWPAASERAAVEKLMPPPPGPSSGCNPGRGWACGAGGLF